MVQLHDVSPSYSGEDMFLRHGARIVARHALGLWRDLEGASRETFFRPSFRGGDLTLQDRFVASDKCALAFRLSSAAVLKHGGTTFGQGVFERSGTLPEFFDRSCVQNLGRLAELVSLEHGWENAPVRGAALAADPPVPRTAELRTAELGWLEDHAEDVEQYAGEWIVIEGTEIVAVADSETEADRQAREKGVSIPFVIRIPREDDPPIIATCQRVTIL